MSSGLEKLKKMREQLNAAAGGGGGGSRDTSVFPFWNIEVGGSASLRFLPDADTNNPFIWAEKIIFKWKFPDPRKAGASVEVQLPCQEMYDGFGTCAVLQQVRPLWKSDEELAKRLWPKKSYIYSGFARRSSWKEESPPDSPIRKFFINKKMHDFIKASILSDDPDTAFMASPDDYVQGRDFVVKKTKNGQWDDYSTSQWANNTSSLTDDEASAIEKYGLIDLKKSFPARPTPEAFTCMLDIFDAHVANQPWNPDWDVHFKAYDSRSRKDKDESGEDSPSMPKASPTGAAAAAIARIRGVAPESPRTEERSTEPTKVENAFESAGPASQQIGSGTAKADEVRERLKALRAKAQA
jgi:hypothetical protein